MNDPLGLALQKQEENKKSVSPLPPLSTSIHNSHHTGNKTKSKGIITSFVGKQTKNTTNVNRNLQHRSKAAEANSTRVKCSFCNHNQAVVMIQKSFTSKSYCLFHYYTTKACRIDTSKVRLLDDNITISRDGEILNKERNDDEFNLQLPYAQEIFRDAFTELQREIANEASKSFQSMVARGNDPLSILMDQPKRELKSKKPEGVKKLKNDIDDSNEGGFILQLQSPKEKQLMEAQSQRIELAARESVEKIEHVNLYKRRKTSSKSSWHLVLNDDKNKNNNINRYKIDFASDVVKGVTCSCGSQEIKSCGNITGRNNDVSKAETWGFKRDNDVSSRYQCLRCNKIWNEES